MQAYIEKAETLIEALPYIRRFSGKTVVIKYGGSAMIDETLRTKVIEDIVLMKIVGINPVIVHGGGKHITEVSKRMGLESSFKGGLRVTDDDTMMVTQMVLAGLINKDLVSQIELHGGQACGLSGKDGSLICAKIFKDEAGDDYGRVGEITSVNTRLLDILEREGYIPVVSPIGVDENGHSLNINADVAAARIAEALKAEKIIFLTDVDGILRDKDDASTLLRNLTPKSVDENIKTGVIESGMLPKVNACVRALKKGVGKVHIINGTTEHALLLEIFTQEGIGTEIVAE